MSLVKRFEKKLAEKSAELERLRKQQKAEPWRDLKAEILRLEGATRALRWSLAAVHEESQAGLFADGGVK